MDVKLCNKCLIERPVTKFGKYRSKCNYCRNSETKEWQKANSERHNQYQTEYKRSRYNSDLNFKLKAVLRARLGKVIKNNWKAGSAVELLGCSSEELKQHLESKFQPGMDWSNWSRTGWNIDHIVPLNSFNLQNDEELSKACHYTNLQPLWHLDNILKSDKVK